MPIAPLLLAFAISAPPSADTIRVGAPLTQLTLPVGIDTVDNYVVQRGEKRLAVTFVQSVSEVPEGYLIVQDNRRPSGEVLSLDSVVVTRGTLATVWHGDVTPAGRRHVAFSDGRMTGTAVDTAGTETSIDEPVPDHLFDYSVMSIVADRLPLSVGYSAVIATYDITRGVVLVPLEVLASESVSVGGMSFDAWRMEVDLGPQTVTRWTERGSGRELRWSLQLADREMMGEIRPDLQHPGPAAPASQR